jgi:hypothetical protein
MKLMKRGIALIGLLSIIGGVFLWQTGLLNIALWFMGKPSHEFDLALKAPQPDYAQSVFWAALPQKEDPADLVPAGLQQLYKSGEAPVDVFFVHPTGYWHNEDWNSPMRIDSVTAENTRWMMANQASPFNGCCNVYAPRYRQAGMWAYMSGDEAVTERALALAYDDVARAFEYYLKHYNQGRPFILAAHSQGSEHGMRLLEQVITQTPRVSQLVAAYLIGGGLEQTRIEKLEDIRICDEAKQNQCIIHWSAFGQGGVVEEQYLGTLLCTNPLTWKAHGAKAPKEQNQGMVVPTGDYGLFVREEQARGAQFGPLSAPTAHFTSAECRDGILYVDENAPGTFPDYTYMPDKDYHLLDFALFYIDIRENAILRSTYFLQERGY